MSRGLPDYMTPQAAVASVQFDGSAVVGGLRGVQSLDGLGRVVYADDFRSGLSGWVAGGTSGGTPILTTVTNYVYFQPVSVRLSGTTGTDWSAISRRVGVGTDSKIGLETVVFVDTSTGQAYIGMSKYTNRGTIDSPEILYDAPNKVWKVKDAVLSYQTFLDWSSYSIEPQGWLAVKMVVDFETGYYVRAIIGETAYDISAYRVPYSANSSSPQLICTIGKRNDSSNFGYVYVGYAIITTDEP